MNRSKELVMTRIVAITLSLLLLAATAWAAAAARRIEITVTEKGFSPDKVKVKKGEPITLAFTRKTDKTCAKKVIVQLGDGKKVEKKLPLDQTVELDVTFAKAGELRYGCSMDMITGTITVE
jgi:plastocyanin domain-containing protein